MTDPFVQTPAFQQAVKAGLVIAVRHNWNHAAVQTRDILTAALPHLERHFRAQIAKELREEAKRRNPDWQRRNVFVAPEYSYLEAADFVEGKR